MGLHGPYAMTFTTGATPSADIGMFQSNYHYLKVNIISDTSFWEGLSVTGLVPKASRGVISGHATGFPSAYANFMSIGFSNSEAQYW